MNEFDIMRDISHCIKGECVLCSRDGGDFCKRELMQDANCVMKMQKDLIEDLKVKWETESKRCKAMATIVKDNIDRESLVDAFNLVVSHFGECEDLQDTVVGVRIFLERIGLKDDCAIIFYPGTYRPRLLLCKDEEVETEEKYVTSCD